MIKEKLAVFIGSKAMYISIISVLTATIAVGGTVVGVQNNKHKHEIEAATATESVTELSVEAVNDVASEPADNSNPSEPSGDRGLQFIREYDKLTAEYTAKREALLEKKKAYSPSGTTRAANKPQMPQKMEIIRGPETEEEYAQRVAQYEQKYAQQLAQYEQEHAQWEAIQNENSIAVSKSNEDEKKYQEIANSIDKLDKQYEKDVVALKATYGI